MQKMSKNCQSSKKNFFAWNNLKRLKIRSQHHLCIRNTICAVHDKFQTGISQKRSCSFYKKSVTPDMQKSQKNFFLSKQP